VSILFPEFMPFILIPVIYHYSYAVREVKPATGSLWSRSRSVFFDKQLGSLRYMPILILLTRGWVSVQIPMNISITTYKSKEVGLNAAVVQSFCTFSSFTTALLFFILYKERLRIQHVVGMLMIIGSLMLVAICK
jgi:drug/metabolite transporter (DMT)-like permease